MSTFADFDKQHSSFTVDTTVAPADGNTLVHLTIQLQYSATVPAARVPVAIGIFGGTASITPASGATDAHGTFRAVMKASAPGLIRLTASVPGSQGGSTLQQTVQFVSIASEASLAFTAIATVGAPQTATVTILDSVGQRVLYYDGTIAFTSSDPEAQLPAPYQFTSADQGQHAFDDVVLNTPGIQSLQIRDAANANIVATASNISVIVKSTPMLALTGISDAIAGSVNQVRVRAVDQRQQTLTDYVGTVHFTSSDPRAVLPADATFTDQDAGVKVLPLTLETAGFQSVTAYDTSNLTISGIESHIAVLVQADRYTVAAAAGAPTAGASDVVHVTATDAFGNQDPNYTGAVTLTSTDLRAVLPGPYAFTPADAGAHDFNVTFFTRGTRTVTAQGTVGSFVGNTQVVVQGAAATRLALLGPASAVAGTPATFVATAYDAFDNVAQDYTGELAIATSDTHAVLPATVSVATANMGSAVITPVTLSTAGTQTVTISDANLALSANAQVTITNGPASAFVLAGTASGPAGRSQAVSVSAFDRYGNPAIDYTGLVNVTSDDPRALLPPATQFTLIDAGSRTLAPVVLKTAGVRTVTVADAANANVRGVEGNILITPLAAAALTVTPPSTVTAAVAQNIVVRAVDMYGNVDPNFAGTVTLSTSDGSAILPGPYTWTPADAGVATLGVTFYTSGGQTVSASGAGLSGTSALVTVVSSAASKLGLSGLTDGRAGRAQSMVVQALDNYNNLVPGYVGTLAATTTDSNATLPAVVTLAASDGGQKLVPVTLVTAGMQSVSAHDINTPSLVGTEANILITATADRLRVQAPSLVTAGGNFLLSVAGVDAYGNVDPNYTGTVSLTSTSTASTLPATVNIASNGVFSSSDFALLGAGTGLTISAQDTVQPFLGSRSGMRVQPGTATHFVVAAANPQFVGLPFSATITAFDAYGNQATGYLGTAALSSSDPNAVLGSVTFGAVGQGSAQASGLVWSAANSSASLTASDSLNPSITGSQTGIVVRAGGAAKLRLTGATSGLSGHIDAVTVMAMDNSNNLATGYTGTVRFSSTDPLASLPAGYAFTAGDAGAHTFNVGWGAAGVQRLTVQDAAAAALTASQNNLVIAAAPAVALHLADPAGSSLVAGASRNIIVAGVDAYGNVDPNYTSTVTLTSSDTGAVLPAPLTVHASANTVYRLVTAGTQSINASDAGAPALTGNLVNIAVASAALAGLSLSGVADAPAGTSNLVSIESVDMYGNRVTAYAGSVHLTSSDPLAVLSGDVTFRAQDQGSRTAPLTLFTGGLQSVTGVDVSNANIAGSQNQIAVRVTRTRLSVVTPANVTAGQGFNITLAAVDTYGNVDPNYTGTVALTSSDTQAFFGSASSGGPGSSASVIFVTGDHGQKSLTGVALALATSSASISAADNGATLVGQRAGILVSPGPLTHFIVAAPASVTPGSAFAVQISAADNANNVVASYAGSLALTTSDTGASLPASISLPASDAGSLHVGNLVLVTAGPQTLVVTDGNGVTGGTSIAVAALSPVALKVSGASSGAAGHVDNVTVTVVDAYGNPANGNAGVVTWTSTDPCAQLPAPYALGTGQSHTFAGLQFQTAGTHTLRATAAPPAGALLAGQQNNIVITGGNATRLTFANLQDATAGQTQNVTLMATDAYGNIDTTFAATATLASGDPNATLAPTATLTAGVAHLQATLVTAGSQAISASGAGLTGTSNPVTIGPATAASLRVGGVANGPAGQVGTATLGAYDAFGNLASNYLGTVALTSSDPVAALPAPLAFTAGDGGSKSVGVTFFSNGTQFLQAADTQVPSLSGQQSNIVVVASARFAITGPASANAGQAFGVTVQAVDNSNNIDPTFTGTVHLSSTDPRATLPADVTFTGSDGGQKTLSGVVLTTAGSSAGVMASTLSAGRAGALYPIHVSIAAATGFTLAAPASVTAGGNFNVTLSATDAYGNVVPTYTGNALLTSNDPNATLPTAVAFASGNAGVRTLSGLVLRTATPAAALTATDSNNPGFVGLQGNITVNPLAVVSALGLSGLTAGVAGHASSVTVAALDAFGNRVPQYRGSLTFTSSDALAQLPAVSPATYTFLGADRGAHTFTGVVLASVGNQTISVTDGSRSASQTVGITPAAATFLLLDTNSSTTAGQAQNVSLTATDPYGNIDTNFSGTVTLASSDPLMLPPSAYTFVALDAGRHSLPITLQSAGTQSVTATAGAISGMQSGIVVNPGATSRLSLAGPTQATTGATVSVVVRALDAVGNTTPSYRGTVHTVSSDAHASLPADFSFTAGNGGVRSTSVTFATSGNQSLSASDTTTPSITGSLANIAVQAPAVRLRLVMAASATAGASVPVTVQVTDNFNNLATGYVGTVAVSSSDAQASYASTLTFAPADQGNKTLSGAFATAGAQTFSVADTQGAVSSTTAGITINSAATDHYDVTAPVNVNAGGNIALALVARDAYGNLTPAYSGTAQISSSDATAQLPGNVTFSGGLATPGIARATQASGGTTFTATDLAQPTIHGTSVGITVLPLATNALQVVGATSGAAGHAQTVSVSARDIYNNLVTSYHGTVNLTSSDAAALLPTSYTFANVDAGMHTFSGIQLVTAGSQSMRATDTTTASITGAQGGINIVAGGATQLQVNGPPSATAGTAVTLAASARDIYGNVDRTFTGTVTMSSADAQAILPPPYAYQGSDAGNHNLVATLATAGPQTLTLSAAGLTAGAVSVVIAPAATTHLAMTGLSNAPAGTPQSVTVRATDNYNNTTPTYRGTVAFASTDVRASLPSNYTYLTGDNGAKAVSATLVSAGLQQVRVVDTLNPNLAGLQNVVVSVLQTQLGVVSNTNVTAGVAIGATLSAIDAYGNINPNYTGTVHLSSSDPNAVLPADITFAAINHGVVTLTNQITFKTVGLTQSLTATDTVNGFVGSQSGIVVGPGPAYALAVSPPASTTAGVPFGIAVTAYDAYHNVATGYTGRIVFAASDANAALPPASTFTLANLGAKTFSNAVRFFRAGTQVLSVTDANNALSGNASFGVQSAVPSVLTLTGPSLTVAGSPLTLTVTAFDAYGNTATGINDTVLITGSDIAATYPAGINFGPGDAGVRVLTNLTTLRTAGLVTLNATDANALGVTPSSWYLTVAPAAINSLVITAPATVTAATTFSGSVVGIDAYSNVANTYSGTVQLVSTDPAGLPSVSVPFPVTFTAGSAAQRVVGGMRLLTAGAQLLSAQDANGTLFGSTQVQVTPGPAAALLLTASPNVTAGQPDNVTVTAIDAGANIAPTFTGTVTFSSTDPNAALPGAYAFVLGDHGQRTLSGNLIWHAAGNQTLNVASSGLVSGNASVRVRAAAVAGLQLYGVGNLVAGSVNHATLRAVDVYGNTAPTYTGTVSFSSSDTLATLPTPTPYVTADAGSKVFALQLYTAGTQSVTATDSGNAYSATQGNIVVSVLRSRFAVTSPNTTVAGVPIALNIAATDAYNNLDTNFTGALHFTSSDANARFPSGVSVIASDHGQKTISNVVLTTANANATITVLDNTNTLVGTVGPIAVAPANANYLGVSGPASVAAGTALSATVTAYDAYANIATGYTGTVAVTTTNANAVLPAPVTFSSNGNGIAIVSSIYLLAAASNSAVTVTDTNVATITGTQSSIQVTPLAADHFQLVGLTSGVAGHVNTLNVIARDIYNNIATGYRGTVNFTSSDPAANLPTNYSYVAGDQGTHPFSGVSLGTVGTQSVTAHDSIQAGLQGTLGGIVITGNSASHLTLTGSATSVAGQGQNILIAAVDAYGNIDANFAGTLAFSTTDPCATLAASHAFGVADAGTFLLPVTYASAAIQTLTAAGPAAVGSAQINTQVSAGNANAYALSGIPDAPAGQATSVTLRVIDAYNNTVPSYTGRAHFTSSDPNATLPADYTFVALDGGVRALGLTLTTAGTQWVRATDANLATITGQQSNIHVGVAQSHLQVTCNTNVTAGGAFAVTVTAVDGYGNLNTGYTGTVHFTSPDANATLPANANVSNSNNGTITVPGVILRIATANQSITATDTNVAGYTGAQSGIRVNPASPAALVLGGPGAATAGSPFTGTVTAYDAYNNVATAYAGSVAFSSSDSNATLPTQTPFVSTYAGSHAFANALTLVHAGNQTISASDSNNALAANLTISVSAAAPALLSLVAPTSSTAGNVILAQVQAQDAYGNLAPTYRGTISFSSGDPCASYPPNYTFSAGDNGSRAFNSNLVLRQAGSQVVNVADANNPSIGAGASVVAVNPAPLSSFRISAPATVVSESSFIATLTGLDIYGNTANTYTGTTRLTSSDANGTPSLVSPINLAFVSGAAVQRSVSGLLLNSGGNQVLYARDANNPNTLSGQANVTVTPLAATSLALSGFPASLTAGQQGNITVRAYDNYGNIATGYLGTVHFTSNDPNAALSPNYTFVPGDQGVHLFAGLSLHTAGSSLAISASDANGLTGSQSPILVAAASPNSIRLTGPATAVAGTAFSVTASAQDIYNNTATTYTGTITFSSSNANALKPAAYTFVAGDAGTHTFSNATAIYIAGSQNITITDASARTSALALSVTSANANFLTWTAPSTAIAGAPLSPALTAYDAYGNLATVYRGTVGFTSNDPNAVLPGPYLFTSTDNGAHAFGGNFALRTSGVRTLVATDGNAGAQVRAGQANVTVSPNITTTFQVTLPASVQPTMPYTATIASRDAYGNATPAYTGTVNLTSTDANGTPPPSPPLGIAFTAPSNGSVTVNNLRLKTLGSQTLTAQDSTQSALLGSTQTLVQAQNFTVNFYFTSASSPNYTYNPNLIAIVQNVASLAPSFTSVGDGPSSTFASGVASNVAYDSNGYLRLTNPNVAQPYLFYSGLDTFDPPLTWMDTIDAGNGNVANVTGLCCGITGPQTNPNATYYYQGNALGSALLYSGNAQGGGNTYAFTKAWSLQGNGLVLDGNSVLSYQVFPQPYGGLYGNTSVNGNNSMYVAVNVVFTDGTDTRTTAGIVDAYNIPLNPNSQGAGGRLALSAWNYVRANLSALSGKTVDHISIGWQNNGATGGYRGFIDQVSLTGHTNVGVPSGSSLHASWTPHWADLMAYWPMDGAGQIANNSNVFGVTGGNLLSHNSNGSGLSYVNGVVGQGILFDGIDDSLVASVSPNFTMVNTFSLWTKLIGASGCPAIFATDSGSGRVMYVQTGCGSENVTYYQDSNYYEPVVSTTTPFDTWSHLAVVFNANSISYYRDGLLRASTSLPITMQALTGFGLNQGYNMIIDEMAIWNAALNANEIYTIYQRQSSQFVGSYVSAPVASPFSGNTASGFSWDTTAPFGKVLAPGSTASESNAVYVGIGATTLNSNLVMLWHMDEPVGSLYAGADFNDFSGSGNMGVQQGTALAFGNNCVLGRCPTNFDGSNWISSTVPAGNAPNVFTTSLWFRIAEYGLGGALIQLNNNGGYDRMTYVGWDGILRFGVYAGYVATISSNVIPANRRWHHVVSTLSSSGMMLYLDGQLVASNSGVTAGINYTGGYWRVGGGMGTSGWPACPSSFQGDIDEVAVWSRALSASEVLQLYRRGADRTQFQVRQCTSATCADNPTWMGPDGTNQTYYSELDFGTGGLTPGLSPLNVYTTAAPALTVNPNIPYVQYRAILQSDDASKLCNYNGVASPCSPELTAAEFYRVNYTNAAPAIATTGGNTPYYALSSMTQALGSTGCLGGVTYTLSPDRVNNYYYTGSAWAPANGTAAQSTSQSLLTNSVINAYSNMTGPQGQTYFTAFLASDGNTPCALQNVAFGGTQ